MRRLPGYHAPNCKNRSSKQYTWLTKMKSAMRSMSGEALKELSKGGCTFADKELTRRANLKK